MSKKLFKHLIKRASQPVPIEQDKQRHPESYNEKQTRSHKPGDTSDSQHGKSRQ
jgi:hypothetical protein